MVIRIVDRPKVVRAELPWPPAANNLHAVVRGRKILSAEGRAYYALVAGLMVVAGNPRAPAGRLDVTVDLFPPNRLHRDIANCEKATIDSLVKAGVIAEDSLIDRLVLTRRPVEAGGRVVVTIQPYEEV